MKKLSYSTITLLWLFLFNCAPEELIDNHAPLTFDQKIILDNGMLSFKDLQTFDSVAVLLSSKDNEFLKNWERNMGIKSIRSVYEKAVSEEEIFLEDLKNKFGDDQSLTREKIGYSEYTNSKLIAEDLLVDDYGIIDMNITTPSLGSILNENRVVKIDGIRYEYGKYKIKNIESKNTVLVERTSRVVDQKNSPTAATFADGSCSNSNGNYKVIGYEENVYWSDGCNNYWDAYIKIRSLRKVLGSWQNYNTGSMSVTATVKIIEWAVSPSGNPQFITRNMVDKTDYTYNASFGNTGYWYFINHQPLQCLGSLGLDYQRAIKYYSRYYTVGAWNSTSCSFGQNPFVFCEMGPCHLITG